MKKSVCWLLSPWLLVLLFPRPGTAQQNLKAGPTPSPVEVPFQLESGFLIVVEGRIGNLKGLKFILDTGTSVSVLDTSIADKLGLPRFPNQVVNYGKTIGVDSATISDVEFGPVRAMNQKMLVADLGKFSDFARDHEAVIGTDLLRLNNLTFDYHTRKVLFSPLEHKTQKRPGRPQPVCFMVSVQVQGHPLRLILDTGLEGVVLFEDRIRAKIPGLRMETAAEKVTIGGRMDAKLATLPGMRLGPTLMDGRVLLMNAPPGARMDDIDGYIGIAPFNTTRIALDFASKLITWE